MILHLAQRLDVPLRERNRLLLAAGYAPVFGERSLDDREMAPVREALARFLTAHEPYPALVMDSHWNIIAANRVVDFLTQGVAEELLAPPANVLRIALHPHGMASRIANFADWSGYLLERLRREIVATRDEELAALREELRPIRESPPARTTPRVRAEFCSCTSSDSTTRRSRCSARPQPSAPHAT